MKALLLLVPILMSVGLLFGFGFHLAKKIVDKF